MEFANKKVPALKCLQPEYSQHIYLHECFLPLQHSICRALMAEGDKQGRTRYPGDMKTLPDQQREVNRGRREELTHNLIQYRLLAFHTALQVLNVTGQMVCSAVAFPFMKVLFKSTSRTIKKSLHLRNILAFTGCITLSNNSYLYLWWVQQ